MRVGVVKELKDHEFRVGLIPSAVRELRARGHDVWVEACAGLGAGIADADYAAAGAKVVDSADEIWHHADVVVKVKEPLPPERKKLRSGQILFAYLHLAPDPQQAKDLMASGATCIAYETVTNTLGGLPLLTPMSEVAGRMSVQVGAHALESAQQGRGILLGGVPGTPAAKVVILGGGVSGTHAATIAIGMGADVTVVDRSADALRRLVTSFGSRIKTAFSTADTVAELAAEADLVIGTVLVPGATAPKVITRDMLKTMKHGSVIVDVAIDQGGCAETSKPTTHSAPTYVVDHVIHYCVANMPGGVARTSTFALNSVTIPFVLALATKGRTALTDDPHFANGLNVHSGHITHRAVAESLGCRMVEPAVALASAP